MIDTLRLNLSDCTISSHTPLTIERASYTHDDQQIYGEYELFVDNKGEIVKGKKAYFNSDKFNITIKPKYSVKSEEQNKTLLVTGPWKVRQDKESIPGVSLDYVTRDEKIQHIFLPEEAFNSGIFVQTSLPRYFNSTNFQSLTQSEEKKAIKQLEKDLSNIGIKCNIWDSTLSRIDTFTNIFTDETFFSYANLFEALQASRMERYEFAGTTFLYKNGERQICIYDKILEMISKLKDKTAYGFLPQRTMRIETRYVKRRKIQSALTFKSLTRLYKDYDYLKENHKKEIETTIFKHDVTEVEKLTGNYITDRMEFWYNRGFRYWMNKYFFAEGVASLLRLSDLDTIMESVTKMIDKDETRPEATKRKIKSRLKNKIEELNFLINSGKFNPLVTKTNSQLYEEIKTKFYKLVA